MVLFSAETCTRFRFPCTIFLAPFRCCLLALNDIETTCAGAVSPRSTGRHSLRSVCLRSIGGSHCTYSSHSAQFATRLLAIILWPRSSLQTTDLPLATCKHQPLPCVADLPPTRRPMLEDEEFMRFDNVYLYSTTLSQKRRVGVYSGHMKRRKTTLLNAVDTIDKPTKEMCSIKSSTR